MLAPPQTPYATVQVVRRPGAAFGTQAIVVGRRRILTIREDFRRAPAGLPGPIVLRGVSPDRRWVFFSIDPQGSASLAADGLMLETVRVADGRRVQLGRSLAYDDYMAWCGSRLVLVAGGDRLVTWNKRLVTASAPDWRPRPLWRDPRRAFGSLACAPDGRSVAVLSQTATRKSYDFFAPRWQLWRVGLDGSRTLLDRPPAGWADESPRIGRDGSVWFVRERKGHGTLMRLGHARVRDLGSRLGYYGHRDWPYRVT